MDNAPSRLVFCPSHVKQARSSHIHQRRLSLTPHRGATTKHPVEGLQLAAESHGGPVRKRGTDREADRRLKDEGAQG